MFGLIDVCNGNVFNCLKIIGKIIEVVIKLYIIVNWFMKKYLLMGVVNFVIVILIKSIVYEG